MSKDKNNKMLSAILAIVFAVIIGVIVITLWVILNKNESIETSEKDEGTTSALECKLESPEEEFFTDKNVQRSEHKITVLFKNDMLSNISYNYTGTFSDNKTAEDAEARMHAKYNDYLGDKGLGRELYNPVFNINKTKVTISLFSDRKNFNNVIGSILFIAEENFPKVGEFKMGEFKKMYEEAGFSCKSHD